MDGRFETFTVLINRISRNIRKIKNQEMAAEHLRSSHISCLYYLYISDGRTATELCELCEEDKATISRSLDYLENQGYLYCESTQGKRYKSPLYLTERGKAVGQRIAHKINTVLDSISLAEEQRISFYHSLTVISESLDAVARKYEQGE